MIAAIYIEKFEDLIDEPQTINLGGKYLYAFEKQDENTIIVTRKVNEQYVEGFFDISDSGCKVDLVSAIVGENGVGKTRLMEVMRFVTATHNKEESYYNHPDCSICAIFEVDNNIEVLFSSFEIVLFNNLPLNRINKDSVMGLYYSPHIDMRSKYSREEEMYGINISFMKCIEQYINGHLSKNPKRGFLNLKLVLFHNQYNFLNSSIYKDNETFFLKDKKPSKEVLIVIQNGNSMSLVNNSDLLKRNIKDIDFLDFVEYLDNRLYKEKKQNHLSKENKKEFFKILTIHKFFFVILKNLNSHPSDLNITLNFTPLYDYDTYSLEALFKHFICALKFNNKPLLSFDKILELYNLLMKVINENPIDIQNYSPDDYDNIWCSILLDYTSSIDLIKKHEEVYGDFLIAHTNHLKPNPSIQFFGVFPIDDMSSGEYSFLMFYSIFYGGLYAINKFNRNNYVLLLDEADLGFHPTWKKKYVKLLLETISYFFPKETKLQIIFTTHDPLTLSDMPNNNVVFLKKATDGKTIVANNKEKPNRTFGANVTDILAHSFFVQDGLIGDFAKEKINATIDWINKQKENKTIPIDKAELEKHRRIVNMIDEPVIRRKLQEMINEIAPQYIDKKAILEQQIEELQRQLKELGK